LVEWAICSAARVQAEWEICSAAQVQAEWAICSEDLEAQVVQTEWVICLAVQEIWVQVLLELRRPHLSERRLLLLEMVLAVPALARVDLVEWAICSAARVQAEWVICLAVQEIWVQLLLELRPPHLSGLRLRLLEMVLAVPALARAVLVAVRLLAVVRLLAAVPH
jgi:hypothetical protein